MCENACLSVHQCTVVYSIARFALVSIKPDAATQSVAGKMSVRKDVFSFLNCIFAEAKIRQRRKNPLVSVIH